ncbi:MAG TPA: CBS domain-containing protein [Motilibacteraceae bacterium]|nr:CBS domain-containing protein [Motilibacteraceae bacterium]
MRARDLARPLPTVRFDDDVLDAARLLATRTLPGLVVLDDAEHPVAILPGSQVLALALPGWVKDDPALARVTGDDAARELCGQLAGRTLRELLPEAELRDLEQVDAAASALEVAALMARMHTPVVAVVDRAQGGRYLGVVTTSAVLGVLLPEAPAAQDQP